MAVSNQKIALRYVDALYSGDIVAAQNCCHADVEFIVYAPTAIFPYLGQQRGHDKLAAAIRGQHARYSRLRYKVLTIVANGDDVAICRQQFLTKRSDGRMIQVDVADFFTFRDSRIARDRSFYDSLNLIQQLLGEDLTEMIGPYVEAALAT